MEEILEQAERIKEYLVQTRRNLHRHPELSMREYQTAEIIEQELDQMGIPHQRIGETGVCGFIKGEGSGTGVIALRADIDALPIQENTDAAYQSENKGVMHACGHDAHTTCLLGAARILSSQKEKFGGEIRLFFQQGEEVGGGARIFAVNEVMTGVDRILGIHTAPDLLCGQVGIKPGINNASVDHFLIEVTGKSSHVCDPQLGVDALYIGSQIVTALQGIVTRMSSPVEPVIIGVGKFQAGTAYNSIASSAVLEGTTRNISPENRKKINSLVQKTAENIASIYGGSVQVTWEDFTSPLINNKEVCQEVAKAVKELSDEIQVVSDRKLYLSGDDFAELQLKVPGAYVYLGTGNPDLPETLNPYHSDCFAIDEDALVIGTAVYAGYSLWWLKNDFKI